jgi:hypothetical protein
MLKSRRIPLFILFIFGLLLPSLNSTPVESSRSTSPTQDVSAIVLSESFESGTLPANWQVTGTPGWRFDNPAVRPNETGGTGKIAIVDSDHEGQVAMDTVLRTPSLNLSTASAVKISFKTNFSTEGISTGDVDVSINNGATWTNLWRQNVNSFTGTVTLNVPQAVGQSNVLFRFHYYNANYAWYWQVDDVKVESTVAPSAPATLSAVVAGPNVNLTWADTSTDEANFIIERSPNGSTGWVEAGRVGANVTTFTNLNVTCGTSAFYRVKATNAALQSGYSNTANITMPACPPAVTGISENFNASQTLPTGWTMPGFPWVFNRPNTTGGTGNAAFADVAGGEDFRELRTPVFSMSGTSAVLLTFRTDIYIYAGQSLAQDANVDISTNGGATWTNVWDKTSAYKGAVAIDLSPWAANQPNVMVRFQSNLPFTGSYWQLDDVVIGAMPVPVTPTNLSVTLNGGNDALLAWNGSTGAKYKVERSSNGGSSWSQIADLTDGATTYVDTSVVSFTAYQYRVRAYNAAGQSAFSTVASATTGDRTIRYVDVTISLHAGAVLTTAADRAKYENNIRYFADGVFEQSNGAHRLRKVTIYRNGTHFDSAHIQWIPACHPNATLSGYIQPGTGARMEFCDAFSGVDFLADTSGQQDGGGTLAHEWGHFFYGMPDEYAGSGTETSHPGTPRLSDVETSTSIMRNQWGAFENNLAFLNHTTAVTGFSLRTAAGRTYGAPAWEVLARPKSQDPQTDEAQGRPYWPELAAVAPAPGVAPRIDLPNPAARASLNIVWEPGFPSATEDSIAPDGQGFTVAHEIVIDRSTLMADSGYLDQGKVAVAEHIYQLPLGDSVGIIAFDGTATIVQPLTTIVDDATRDTLVAAVNGITPGGAEAAAGVALELALAELTASMGADAIPVVYHITQGSGSTGVNAITVVPDYESAEVPLYVFGFNPEEGDASNLRQLAELTTGEYSVVRTAGELENALTEAQYASSPYQDVVIDFGGSYIDANEKYSVPMAFDSTLVEMDFDITYFAEPSAATVTLIDPLGATYEVDPTTDCEFYGDGDEVYTSCYLSADAPDGIWTIQVEATEELYLQYYVTGVAPEGDTTYGAVVSARENDVTIYPEPIVVYAMVSRGFPIGGLDVVGQVEEENGNVYGIDFYDDGIAPDNIADDGIYSAYVDYTESGEHYISVEFYNYEGNAFYSNLSFGDTADVPLEAIDEVFEREAYYQVTVMDWQADDHTDWSDDPNQAPTLLTVDNVQVHGRIDAAYDADVFQVTVPADYAEETLGVRLNSLGLGMDPYVFVYAADYSWQFEYTLVYVATSEDTVYFAVDAAPGETFFIEVYHYEDEATTGTYDISAGPQLWSDPLVPERPTYTLRLPVIQKQ